MVPFYTQIPLEREAGKRRKREEEKTTKSTMVCKERKIVKKKDKMRCSHSESEAERSTVSGSRLLRKTYIYFCKKSDLTM